MIANPFRIKLVRGLFSPPQPGAIGSWPWPPAMVEAVFQSAPMWSVRSYWQSASFGILNPTFEVEPGLFNLYEVDSGACAGDREIGIPAIVDGLRNAGAGVDGFDGLITFVNPPPTDAGAWVNRALLDQGGGLEFYAHEVGHMMGLQHAFGWQHGAGPSPTVYEDPYCVMGYTGPQSHSVDAFPEAAGVITPLPGNFWQSGRRVATANLHRHFPEEMSRWVRRVNFGQQVVVGASSAVAEIGWPGEALPLAVVALTNHGVPGPPWPELTVEYRVPTGDDLGVTPAVVVHTIGLRGLNPGYGEVRPIVFEGTVPPGGGTLQVQRTTVSVVGSSPGGAAPPTVTVIMTTY